MRHRKKLIEHICLQLESTRILLRYQNIKHNECLTESVIPKWKFQEIGTGLGYVVERKTNQQRDTTWSWNEGLIQHESFEWQEFF